MVLVPLWPPRGAAESSSDERLDEAASAQQVSYSPIMHTISWALDISKEGIDATLPPGKCSLYAFPAFVADGTLDGSENLKGAKLHLLQALILQVAKFAPIVSTESLGTKNGARRKTTHMARALKLVTIQHAPSKPGKETPYVKSLGVKNDLRPFGIPGQRDGMGAHAVHALAVANNEDALALLMVLFKRQPELMHVSHDGTGPFYGESTFHVCSP